jgi:hypothetical protein
MSLGLATIFSVGPKLIPLAPRFEAAIETFQRVSADPAIKAAIAAIPAIEKLAADPAVKDAIAVFQEAAQIIAQAQQSS